ncbi:MAG: polyhydroxyalkanoic acid system family protein [Planctomycetales bacterium]|nr:polyhydroxyalkanoic acid system family protein [Planctomycetales bacterium]
MQPISIDIHHSLGKEEARRRIDAGFDKIRQQLVGGLGIMFKLDHKWNADRLELQGSGLGQRLQGYIDVFADRVTIQLELPALLAAAADAIADKVKRQSQVLLEDRSN